MIKTGKRYLVGSGAKARMDSAYSRKAWNLTNHREFGHGGCELMTFREAKKFLDKMSVVAPQGLWAIYEVEPVWIGGRDEIKNITKSDLKHEAKESIQTEEKETVSRD